MINYTEMKDYFHSREYSGSHKEAIAGKIIDRSETIIGEKNIKLFYPKNIFLEEKDFELYVFCQNNTILKVSEESNNLVVTNFYNIENVEKFVLKENYKNEDEKILEIKFKNNEIFTFNSGEDTNEYYKRKLASVIEEICKNIIL